MEMSLNRTSSALLPWLLWVLFLPSPVAPTIEPAPTSTASQPTNSTLLFDSGAPGNSLRNCSCSVRIRDCDEALANLLCSCRTVPRSALPPAGLREPGGLTVWLREPWVLQELLNRSMVSDLHLSFCGANVLDSQHLALFGLRTLRIHSATPGAPHPDQHITISPPGPGSVVEGGLLSSDTSDTGPISSSSSSSPSSSSTLHVTFLDVAVLNGLSTLKAYSVVGLPVATLSQRFPHLPLPSLAPHDGPTDPNEPAPEPQQDCVLTIIY